jgi:phosphoribosylaminoimidazole carboxylase
LTYILQGSIIVNEVAPRPHNSGHLFIEAIPYMSQYKAHIYSLIDIFSPYMELRPRVSAAIMLNILGGANGESHSKLVNMARQTYHNDMDVFLHLYGKTSKPGRKIGHVTVTSYNEAVDLEQLAAPLTEEIEYIRQIRLATLTQMDPSNSSQSAKSLSSPSTSSRDTKNPLVVVTMGSDSDLPVLKGAFEILERFSVPYDFAITSAHRTPSRMVELGKSAASRGIRVLIAAAGGAAHLPGMLASETTVPVIGIPIKATHLDGQDSLLSIVQMPRGCPVATVGINNSTNAALLAVKILGSSDSTYREAMANYMKNMGIEVEAKAAKLQAIGWEKYLDKR